ncbi:sensor domain-containing diguanylate cyclase [Bacillus pinisoli]|uniref:sensor domain-containing diguanylate cyclase n=1 Tax=Bacillus pinisoli TaxID=2901866 RepID=UPI001FF1DD9D|nr:sensor domain-containing diguanylate cyclase [Bacillus pinisoli]
MECIYLLVGLLLGAVGLQIYKLTIKATVKERWANEKRIYNLVESSKDIIYYYDLKPEKKFRYLSPSIEKVLGAGLVEESYKNPNTPIELIHPDDHELLLKKLSGQLDYNKPIIQRWKNAQGEYIHFEEYATPIYENGEIVAIQGIIRNIDEKVKMQQDLEYRISHDSLTGIYNRNYFDTKMEKFNKTNDSEVAIILCDLDELKQINDTLGHRSGDLLIKEAGQLLNQFSNQETTVARIGGDEFAILINGEGSQRTEKLVSDIKQAVEDYNQTSEAFHIKVSMGATYSPTSIGNMSKLFVTADAKMYKEKNKKKEVANGCHYTI